MVLNILRAGCRARCFLAVENFWVFPIPARPSILTCCFLFQSTQSLMKPALEPSGISCVGSAVNTIRLNVSALERRKWWVIPSRAAGTRRMNVTPAWFTQVSVRWETSGRLHVFWGHWLEAGRTLEFWQVAIRGCDAMMIKSGITPPTLTTGGGTGRVSALFSAKLTKLWIHLLIHSLNKQTEKPLYTMASTGNTVLYKKRHSWHF